MTVTPEGDPFLGSAEFERRREAWCSTLGLDGSAAISAIERSALLVLDMQNDFLLPAGQLPVWGGPAMISNVRALIDAFRANDLPLIFTRHVCLEPFAHRDTLRIMDGVSDAATLLAEGSIGAALHEQISVRAGEPVLTKYRYSAFYDSPLDTLLKVNGIQTVVITGVATNICCETTAHDAFFRGYRVLFTVDSTGGTSEPAHLATLSNIRMSYGEVVTTSQLVAALGSLRRNA